MGLFICLVAQAQLNVSYISDVSYNTDLNDIWGYVAPDGTEYALVGLRNGVSIVSLADPANPVEVANIPGSSTTWRDLKTWGETAYVTCDACGDGLLVIDLSDLPNSAPYYNWTDVPGGGIGSCHNIYIDEHGYAYLAGCGANNGGMVFIDCFSEPGTPIFAGFAPSIYAHDVYTRDNLMYASEIYAGVFAIYDVSDKSNVQFLGSQVTPAEFTHNTWLSDDGNYIFTTDETGNAPVASYDISDPTDIVELDQFRPLETLGEGVIPHNVHVWNDYLIISYYTDGCIVVDASRPDNLVLVGNFDTYIPASTGFSGAWGAYPFLPSGLILISDIGNGLYVLEPNYVRACHLEGAVTDASTGLGISNVNIEIATTELYDVGVEGNGDYATGLAIPGTFEVTYSSPGYVAQTIVTTFENGGLNIQDVMLEPLAMYSVSGSVTDAVTGEPIPFAAITVIGEGDVQGYTAGADGNFTFSIFEGSFEVAAGIWGYGYGSTSIDVTAPLSGQNIELYPGYEDDFAIDYGWTVSGDAARGIWERGEPDGTTYNGDQCNPDFDVSDDTGNLCFVTGNGGGGAGDDDVDNGMTILTSPVMDLSDYNTPVLSFSYWFFNDGGGGNSEPPNDALTVVVSNGEAEITIATYNVSISDWFESDEFFLSDVIDITDNMQVSFIASDLQGSGHLVEAAIDAFRVTDFDASGVEDFSENGLLLTAAPNPFSNGVNIVYEITKGFTSADLHIYNVLGECIQVIKLADGKGNVRIAEQLTNGIYFVQLKADNKVGVPLKIVKSAW